MHKSFYIVTDTAVVNNVEVMSLIFHIMEASHNYSCMLFIREVDEKVNIPVRRNHCCQSVLAIQMQRIKNISFNMAFPDRKSKPLQVMLCFGPFLRILQVYNWDNFHGGWRKRFQSITNIVGVLIPQFMLYLMHSLLYYRCIERKAYTDPVIIPLLLVGQHITSTHILCAMKNRQISQSIEYLQAIIESRK